MNSGIYSLTNQRNGKRYIGRTIHFQKRKTEHFCALRHGNHPNNHLQRAWDRGDRFNFEIVEQCPPEKCNEREIYWIAKFDTMRTGYNQCAGGAATLGRVCSEETRRKISEKNAGRKCSQEAIKRRTESLKAHIENDPDFAERRRRLLSERWKGKPSWNAGVPCPEWMKELLREKLKGRAISEWHKEKLRTLYSGENSLSAKLKESDVVAIRYRFLRGERQADIAKEYPVTPQTIHDICRGRRWKSIPNSLEELEALYERTTGQKPSL